MIDLAPTELEQAVLDTLDRVLADAGTPGWSVEDGRCTPDTQLWSALSELAVFDAGMADDGVSFASSALVADRLGASLKGLALIDHVVALRLLERLGGDAGRLRAEVVERKALVGVVTPPQHLAAGPRGICATGAIADHILRVAADGTVEWTDGAGGGAASENLGDLPVATCEAPSSRRLTSDAEAVALLVAERKTLVASALGGMSRHAIALAADYAKERCVFGGPIGAFQSLAHGMASGKVHADGIELLSREAAWARDGDPTRFERLAGMAYAFAAAGSIEATRFAMHVFGGYGVTREYPVQAYFRTAKALCLLVGDPRLDLRRTGAELIAAARGATGVVRAEV